jgi:hypothetical protein
LVSGSDDDDDDDDVVNVERSLTTTMMSCCGCGKGHSRWRRRMVAVAYYITRKRVAAKNFLALYFFFLRSDET